MRFMGCTIHPSLKQFADVPHMYMRSTDPLDWCSTLCMLSLRADMAAYDFPTTPLAKFLHKASVYGVGLARDRYGSNL